MPSWIINLLIQLIIKMGFPWLIQFIIEKFPNIDPAILDILQKLLDELSSPKVPNPIARAKANLAFKKKCHGVGCKSSVVE